MQQAPNKDAVQLNSYTTAAGGGDCAKTISADANEYWTIDAIHCSYAAACTGKLTIAYGATPTTVWEVDITAGGPREFLFPGGLCHLTTAGVPIVNEDCVITMLDGAQTKYLNVSYR